MSEYPTIISFYTRNWEYPEYAKKMKRSCVQLGLEHHIVEKQNTGNWLKNTAIKPHFILEALQELKRPVLWIDVDGSILKRPELLKSGYPHDFAARRMAEHRSRIWQVGTMYFNYTEATLNFLNVWTSELPKYRGSDEGALDIIWRSNPELVDTLSVGELPKEYFEMLRGTGAVPSSDTIVCHRASKDDSKMEMKRRHKNLVHARY